jgi:hypothetical protein
MTPVTMTVRPILFSAPMVRALLEGRKTQTRRLAAKRINTGCEDDSPVYRPSAWTKVKPGDLLWVRETWGQFHPVAMQPGRYFQQGEAGIPGPPGVPYNVLYRADGETMPIWHSVGWPYRSQEPDALDTKHFPKGVETGWESPIHCPRKWSRLTLEVTGVKIERLQAITHEDAECEGVRCDMTSWGFREHFADLWKRLHGADSWDANPEIVALTFTVHKQNIDAFLKQREAT